MRALSQVVAQTRSARPLAGLRRFPDGFLWGAGTSAYQIEGGIDLDGRQPSIWDTFAAAGHARGDTGDPGADHRRRMVDDVALIAELGLPAYRFSIAWPRVQPKGAGAVSQPGLDFYRALVDELLARGVEPIVTLYHWDLPQALEDSGGWPAATPPAGSPTTPPSWPMRSAIGFGAGPRSTSPGAQPCSATPPASMRPAAANRAPRWPPPTTFCWVMGWPWTCCVPACPDGDSRRTGARRSAITLNPYPVVPTAFGSETSDADRDAVRRIDGIANRLWYDAVLRGAYPDDVLEDLASVSDLAHIRDGDLAQIARPDRRAGAELLPPPPRAPRTRRLGSAVAVAGFAGRRLPAPAYTPTSNGWAVEPDGLFDALVRVATDYDPPPLYVHESGGAFPDVPGADGRVHDADRRAYLDAHLRACHDAIAAGVDLRGFFVWSLLDNFEWAEGYGQRFGIVHVDFASQRRTPKASALWLRDVIAANGLSGA